MNATQAVQFAHERAMFHRQPQTLRRIVTNGRERFLLATHHPDDEKREDYFTTVEP